MLIFYFYFQFRFFFSCAFFFYFVKQYRERHEDVRQELKADIILQKWGRTGFESESWETAVGHASYSD